MTASANASQNSTFCGRDVNDAVVRWLTGPQTQTPLLSLPRSWVDLQFDEDDDKGRFGS